MLKYVSKFTLDVLPSLLATVIGAYIVNHYIVAKPDTPVAAATSTANPKPEAKAEPSADVANIPEPGVRAKGISEKAILDKSAAEKPAARKARGQTRRDREHPFGHAAAPACAAREDRRQDGARAAACCAGCRAGRRHASVVAAPIRPSRRQRLRKSIATPTISPRAAIERLRGITDSSPRAQEAARAEIHRASRMRPGSRRCHGRSVSHRAAVHRSGRFRRRSWSPRLPVKRSIRRQHRRGKAALRRCRANRRPAPPDAAGRYSGRRRRSICVPRRRNQRRGNTRTLPKTCCRRRNRCFTRSCRNNSAK